MLSLEIVDCGYKGCGCRGRPMEAPETAARELSNWVRGWCVVSNDWKACQLSSTQCGEPAPDVSGNGRAAIRYSSLIVKIEDEDYPGSRAVRQLRLPPY
jgi:hypothetical protein